MKTNQNKLILLIASAMILLATGCAKKGCTDELANNFDDKAKKSDNSCQYTGDVVFWYGKETSESLVASGAISLKYYFDNQLVGSTSADVYVVGTPDCGTDGIVTVSKPLGGNKNGAYTYRVEDQLGFTRFEGIINLEGGRCVKKQLGS